MIKVNVDASGLEATLDAITSTLADREKMLYAADQRVRNLWDEHFETNYQPTDPPGIDFWAKVRGLIENRVDGELATVTAYQLGLRLRYMAGTVTPGTNLSSYTGLPTRALAKPSRNVPTVDGEYIPPLNASPLAFIEATRGNAVGYLVKGEEVGTIKRGGVATRTMKLRDDDRHNGQTSAEERSDPAGAISFLLTSPPASGLLSEAAPFCSPAGTYQRSARRRRSP